MRHDDRRGLQRLAGPAVRHADGHADRSGDRPFAHGLRHPGHSGGHSDPAGPVVGQSGHHGHEGQSGPQREQAAPAGFSALSAGGSQRNAALLYAPDFHRGAVRAGDHSHSVLVLRHGAGLLHPRDRRQSAYVQGAGHQHQQEYRAGPDDLQRAGGAFRRAFEPVPELCGHQHGPALS